MSEPCSEEELRALESRGDIAEACVEEVRRLRSQLPEEMQHCTILFRECDKGHGRLTAANWIDHGCHACEIERLRELLA